MDELLRAGAVALSGDGPGRADARTLRVVFVVGAFRRASGSHATVAGLARGLTARGHDVAICVADEDGRHAELDDTALGDAFTRAFGPVAGGVARFDAGALAGTDVLVAAGWQTVPATLRAPGVHARVHLVQDFEPELYAASAERAWAAWVLGEGLPVLCSSSWLAAMMDAQYGVDARSFDPGYDDTAYVALPTHRREDLVLLHARANVPRDAAPLGVLTLAELRRRRPELSLALAGDARPIATPFEAMHVGAPAAAELARAYASATVGIALSMTVPAPVALDMLACGLSVVGLDTPGARAAFGADDCVELAAATPADLADAVERLLDDIELRADRARAGMALVAARSWADAAEQVEDALRAALGAAS